jgi:hypothetical protein
MMSATPSRRLKTKLGGGGAASSSGSRGIVATLRNSNRFLVLFGATVFCLGSFSLFPILVMESVTVRKPRGGAAGGKDGGPAHVSPGHLVADHAVQRVREQHAQKQRANAVMAKIKEDPMSHEHHIDVPKGHASVDQRIVAAADAEGNGPTKRKVPAYQLQDLTQDVGFRDKPVARGVSGRPDRDTPAVDGAKRAHIECEINVDSLAYWNDPQGTRDGDFVSPFRVANPDRSYITFNPDHGGALLPRGSSSRRNPFASLHLTKSLS